MSELKEAESQNSKEGSVEEEVRSGLTWRSLLALVYVMVTFQPAFIYLFLMTGGVPIASAVQWATIILFVELTRFSGSPLTRQEAAVIYLAAGMATKYFWFISPGMQNLAHPGWLYQVYFKHSPAAVAFGLADKIPWFYAPVSDEPWITRTFFHPDWIPMAMVAIAYLVTAMLGDGFISMIMYVLYVEVENLPFPQAIPVTDSINTLIEREPKRLSFLSATALFAGIYGFILYVMPLLTEVFFGSRMSLIPVPWADLNLYVHRFLPGGMFGIATDLAAFVVGFIIPFKAIVGSFIGSFATMVIGNSLLVSMGLTSFAEEYIYGMPIQTIWQRSFLHVWAIPTVGMALAVGVAPLIKHPELISRTAKTLSRLRETRVGVSPWLIVGPFVLVSVGLSLFDWWLAPDTPIYILLFLNTVWPFLMLLIAVRGESLGVSFSIPYMRELTLKSIGYTGINGWFVPIYGASSWTTSLKVCRDLKTKPLSYIFANYFAWTFGLAIAFFFVQSFWRIAPIPSTIYPGTLYNWPILATFQAIFTTPEAGKFFDPMRILYGFIPMLIAYFILDSLGLGALAVGFVSGASSAIPGPLAMLIGGIIAQIVRRKMGEEFYRSYRGIIVAGVLLGEGMIVTAGSAVAIIVRSGWNFPY